MALLRRSVRPRRIRGRRAGCPAVCARRTRRRCGRRRGTAPPSRSRWSAPSRRTARPMKMDVKSTLRLESPDTLRVEMTARVAGQTAPRTTPLSTSAPARRRAARPAPMQKAQATMAQVAWISGVWTGAMGSSAIEERWTPRPAARCSRSPERSATASCPPSSSSASSSATAGSSIPRCRTAACRRPTSRLTKIDDTSATFENPAHDFPKMIRYTKRPDGSLEAVISGEGGQKAQTFLFKRQ